MLAVGACLAGLAVAGPAFAADPNRLFADSTLVTLERMSVEVVGNGPDIMLIPGLASSRDVWRRTAERLRSHYRLHLVQVAGFAGEPARSNATGPVLAPMVAALHDYIVHAGLHRLTLVGHSLGGLMALLLALDHPDDIGKLMIVDTLAFYTELFAGPTAQAAFAQPYADAIATKMLAESDADYARSSAHTAESLTVSPADQARVQTWSVESARPVVARLIQEDMTTDLRPRLKNFSLPVTILYEAPLDALMHGDYAGIRTATLIIAKPGARHFLMFDDPAGFDAALDKVLAP